MNLASIPRRCYTHGSTAIEFLPRLSQHFGGPHIYIKRDDQLGLAAGGNKTRKLEFIMADALRKGADTVITTGAVQSNHCRLTLAAAVTEGMKCRLVLEERVPGSYSSEANGNNFLFKLLGAEHIEVVEAGTDLDAAMNEQAADVTRSGGSPYVIPGGASNDLGALGYVACAQELMMQTFAQSLSLDHIVCASGSGGTHAGLVAGMSGCQAQIPVTGISVRANRDEQEKKILGLARSTAQLAGSVLTVTAAEVSVNDGFVGPGYSLPTREMAEAIQLFARAEGILLDPVYTGKTAAGLIAFLRDGTYPAGSNVLLLHTGGSPGLYAYPDEALSGVRKDGYA